MRVSVALAVVSAVALAAVLAVVSEAEALGPALLASGSPCLHFRSNRSSWRWTTYPG
eukprot:CAMPEP_0115241842 /NCGR_PEP_ID=MMETSP0270-20121206/38638_1 /TAXON_ID=71861 /ORGANISM="Scrippsiella trochoidea, Strain CCMP3099" /LENGTH=56 /DNA_ID=CAMNT_0002656875 /DNA_START=49 /DNA_END=215 /DNA_ORIENTATION=+